MHLKSFLGNAFGKDAFSEPKNAYEMHIESIRIKKNFLKMRIWKPKNAFSLNADWPMTVELRNAFLDEGPKMHSKIHFSILLKTLDCVNAVR